MLAILAGDREADLSAAESQDLEAHLDRCAKCRAALGQAEDDVSRLVALADPALEPVLEPMAWSRVDDAIRAELKRAREAAPALAPVLSLAAARQELGKASPPVASAVRAGRAGAGARGFPIALAAAGLLVAFGLFAASGIGPGPGASAGIGRVKPPEADDVAVIDVKFNGRVKGVKFGALIMVLEGLGDLTPFTEPTPSSTPTPTPGPK